MRHLLLLSSIILITAAIASIPAHSATAKQPLAIHTVPLHMPIFSFPTDSEQDKNPETNGKAENACKTGCGSVYKYYESTDEKNILTLLEALANTQVGDESKTLDTLLYHWPDLEPYLLTHTDNPAGTEWTAYLKNEMRRKSVILKVRTVSDDGTVNILHENKVWFGKKAHLNASECKGVQAPEIGTTTVRVGQDWLWTRF